MTRPVCPSVAQMKRAAELAKQLNVSIKVEPDGSFTVAPLPIAPIAVDRVREIVL